jgi:hypothetical protein
MKQLVFVHGRAQQHKDAVALKAEWIDSWRKGLADSALDMPITESDIRFPYYGDTLFDLAAGKSAAEAAAVVVKGMLKLDAPETLVDPEQRAFVREVLLEVERKRGISAADIADVTGRDVTEKGALNWGWVQDLLETIDRRIPFASGASIALATNDVYQYLENDGIRATIENGVRQALTPGMPTVVVSHSLGTVVAYNLLRREGSKHGWNVPLFVTLGSPLGVNAIRKKLSPNEHPACADSWFNAFDERDVVALFPLDEKNFLVDPSIRNKTDVNNLTANRHGISGYLSDPEVARTIYEALTS